MPPLRTRAIASLILALVLAAAGICCAQAVNPLLRRGMRGAEVRALQELLRELGYGLAVDGVFGAETERVVKEVQDAAGLDVDGLVGPQTWTVLAEMRKSVVTYTVQRGDNLTGIARQYNTTVAAISRYNGLSNPDRLLTGQVLLIPIRAVPASASAGTGLSLQWPVKGRISSSYGYRTHPILNTRHFHGGIDIAVPEGTPVKAAEAGRVIRAGNMGNYGLGVVLDHGGVTTWYGHNSKLLVRVGDTVKKGQTIALVGRTGLTTGPHLDFRIKIGDQTIDPLQLLP